jgi:hypothetical protein
MVLALAGDSTMTSDLPHEIGYPWEYELAANQAGERHI